MVVAMVVSPRYRPQSCTTRLDVITTLPVERLYRLGIHLRNHARTGLGLPQLRDDVGVDDDHSNLMGSAGVLSRS